VLKKSLTSGRKNGFLLFYFNDLIETKMQ